MDSDSTFAVVGILLALGVFAAMHIVEAALPPLRSGSLRERAGEGLPALALRKLRSAQYAYEDATRILRFTAVFVAAAWTFALIEIQLAQPFWTVLLGMSALWMALLVIRSAAVRAVSRLSEPMLLITAVVIQFALWPSLPLARLSAVAQRSGRRPFGGEPNGTTTVVVVEEEPEVEATVEERRMIHAILRLEDTAVREIMVPRVDIIGVEASTPLPEAIHRLLHSGHSRLPVYEESLDGVVGLLYGRDLLDAASSGNGQADAVRSLARPPFFVPESKRVDELLREFQERHVHMALVVDEYGGVAGLVTIEDLLEEIVGEIEDEFDASEPTIEELAEGEAVVDARMPIEAFNAHFRTGISGTGFDTLGGYLFSHLGKIPTIGDVVSAGGVRMEVLNTIGRRIKKVRVVAAPSHEDLQPARGRRPAGLGKPWAAVQPPPRCVSHPRGPSGPRASGGAPPRPPVCVPRCSHAVMPRSAPDAEGRALTQRLEGCRTHKGRGPQTVRAPGLLDHFSGGQRYFDSVSSAATNERLALPPASPVARMEWWPTVRIGTCGVTEWLNEP